MCIIPNQREWLKHNSHVHVKYEQMSTNMNKNYMQIKLEYNLIHLTRKIYMQIKTYLQIKSKNTLYTLNKNNIQKKQ